MHRHSLLIYHPRHAKQFSAAIQVREELCQLVINTASSDAQLAEHISDTDILITTNYLPQGVLERASRLKWIHVAAAGVDGVMQAGISKQTLITRTLGTFGIRMAEYVCCYLLVVTQRVRQIIRQQAEHRWQPLPLSYLNGAVVGIAGVGNIGSTVAKRLHQFGMTTHGLATGPKPLSHIDSWFTPDAITSFVRDLDFLVITLPLTPTTKGLFGRETFSKMRRSAWLLNIGRGQVVDEAALCEALEGKQIAGAILDVFTDEPLPTSSPLWSLDNVIVTPHHSGDALPSEVIDAFAANYVLWKRGKGLVGQVDPEKAY